jgi:SDR family mycofactocin-dependent oxidoreductase
MSGSLAGKVALITGAARGQGRAHAVALAEEGSDVVMIDLCAQIESVPYPMATPADLDHTAELVAKTGQRVIAVQADVRDLPAMRAIAQRAVDELGSIDIVLANAGIMTQIGPRADEDQTFYDAIDVMVTGAWHTLRATVPFLIDQGNGGAIVITSSTAGVRGVNSGIEAGSAGYAAAKHAVVGLMRVYANMLAQHRIRVNCLHPTGVRTPMVDNDVFTQFARENPDVASAMQNPLPVEVIEPEDVAQAVLWLVRESGRFVTGVSLPVDAGFLNRV